MARSIIGGPVASASTTTTSSCWPAPRKVNRKGQQEKTAFQSFRLKFVDAGSKPGKQLISIVHNRPRWDRDPQLAADVKVSYGNYSDGNEFGVLGNT